MAGPSRWWRGGLTDLLRYFHVRKRIHTPMPGLPAGANVLSPPLSHRRNTR